MFAIIGDFVFTFLSLNCIQYRVSAPKSRPQQILLRGNEQKLRSSLRRSIKIRLRVLMALASFCCSRLQGIGRKDSFRRGLEIAGKKAEQIQIE